VHLNDGAGLSTIVAQGNIGSNVGGTEAKTYSVTANGTSSYVLMAKGLPTLIIQTYLQGRYLHF
jgi:hypothetical protein